MRFLYGYYGRSRGLLIKINNYGIFLKINNKILGFVWDMFPLPFKGEVKKVDSNTSKKNLFVVLI